MSVNYTIQQTTDLQEMAHPVVFPDALLTPGDAAAHRLVLTVKDGGTAATLTGYTAYGYFERVGGTIIAVPGEITGNTVTLTFTRSCYAFPGRLRLLVRVTDSAGSVITLTDDLFRVGQGLGNEVIDEGELIASLPELLTAVERLEAANTYAETFGDRVISLEKSTTGSWFPAMQVGGISTVDGSNTSSTNASGKARSRSVEYIPYSAGQVVTPASGYSVIVLHYNSASSESGSLISYSEWQTRPYTVQECAYFRLLVRNPSITDFTNVVNDFITVTDPGSIVSRLNAIEAGATYDDLTDRPVSIAGNTFSRFGSATVSGNTATLTKGGDGLRTGFFESASESVRVRATLTYDSPTIAAWVRYRYLDGTGETQAGNVRIDVEIASGEEFSFAFDAAYYAAHHNALDFNIMFNAPSGAGGSEAYQGTTITVDNLLVYEEDAFRQSQYYDRDFPDMMQKVFDGITSVAASSGESNGQVPLRLVAPNGGKYHLLIGAQSALTLVPHIPTKVLFVGNSLLLGMNRRAENQLYSYGMCATGHTKDYYWRVKAAILEKNPSATFSRLFGAPLEELETTEAYTALWSTDTNEFTHAPMRQSFTADLDLIILQLGDNVNTPAKRAVFPANMDAFIRDVRTASPNARIIWVDSWYHYSDVHPLISAVCSSWGIEELDIHALNTAANRAVSGQSYENENGRTSTVDDGWITHPGDAGMAAIAESIIHTLDM